MEFNVIDENNKFKIGNIISVFKLPNYDEKFAIFSLSDFDDDDLSLQVAYLLKDKDGYDYIEEIEDSNVLKTAMEAVKEIMKNINF